MNDARPFVVIVGGGIAGLWTAVHLAGSGFRVGLIERGALGSEQTLGSQGIIHGGVKYALGGSASSASRAIASMPGRWRDAMEGKGSVDLRGAKVLSQEQVLWSTQSLLSRFTALAASKVIRTPMDVLGAERRPRAFDGAPSGVTVYGVGEPVLDAQSVVEVLVSRARELGVMIRCGAEVQKSDVVGARAVVVCAGRGAMDVLARLGVGGGSEAVRMQVRPLHMLMVREARADSGVLPTVYGHCVGVLTDKPMVTITTHVDLKGRRVWYVGGQVAESGVQRTGEEQIAEGRRVLNQCIGWVDVGGKKTEWGTIRWDRAEGLNEAGVRPDEPIVREVGRVGGDGESGQGGARVVVVWPTKLAFAPRVGDVVVRMVGEMTGGVGGGVGWDMGGRVEVGAMPWQRGEVAWS